MIQPAAHESDGPQKFLLFCGQPEIVRAAIKFDAGIVRVEMPIFKAANDAAFRAKRLVKLIVQIAGKMLSLKEAIG
jgi:hypothetical protein